MKSLVRFLFVVKLVCSFVSSPTRAEDECCPNVLFVMCHQLNAGVLSCYGGPISAPDIDRIADKGVLFDLVIRYFFT